MNRRGPDALAVFAEAEHSLTEVNFGWTSENFTEAFASSLWRCVWPLKHNFSVLDSPDHRSEHGAGPDGSVFAVRVYFAGLGQVGGVGFLLPGYGQRLHLQLACWPKGMFLPNHEERGFPGDWISGHKQRLDCLLPTILLCGVKLIRISRTSWLCGSHLDVSYYQEPVLPVSAQIISQNESLCLTLTCTNI